jgi:hypothetical protein
MRTRNIIALHDKSYYLLTYMALQPRFGQGLSEKILPLYSISMFSQATQAPICSLDFLLYLQVHVVLWCHKSTLVHKFVDDFEILVAKCHNISGVENCPLSSRNHVFWLLFVDLQSCFCRQCRYHRH